MAKDFYELGVRPDLIEGLVALGIEKPTPIQRQVIPQLLTAPADLIAQAQTGTGKTAAFGIPLIEKMDHRNPSIQGLVVAPTRELTKQVGKQLFRYTKFYDDRIYIEVAAGGDKIAEQTKRLSRPTQILVASPGRLLDLLQAGLTLEAVKFLVLDEADEMLNLGFQKELSTILEATKQREALWLFSATFQSKLKRLIEGHVANDTTQVRVDDREIANDKITHEYAICDRFAKDDWIADFLERHEGDRGILFCRTRAGARKMGDSLSNRGREVAVLEGDLSQKDRDRVMRAFKGGRIQCLIATDVAARGIDVDQLAFVLHHQLPDADQYYIHRSGRTARAGMTGRSIVLIEPDERSRLQRLESSFHLKFELLDGIGNE